MSENSERERGEKTRLLGGKTGGRIFEVYYSNEAYYLGAFWRKYNFQMRYFTLFLMAVQCICVVLCMKLSVSYPASDGKQYLTPVAVVLCEILKFLTCMLVIFRISGGNSLREYMRALNGELTYDIKGNLLVCIPGLLFLFQNNLTYVALERLPVSVYQVTAQLKVLTTAVFSVLLLKRRLGTTRWIGCIMLFVGVLLVQKSSGKNNVNKFDYIQFTIGFLASVTCSITSGLGSVIIEKVVKDSDREDLLQEKAAVNDVESNYCVSNGGKVVYKSTVWGRNIILSLIGIFGGIPVAWFSSKDKIIKDGIFQGFSKLVVLVIFLNAFGGFIVMGVLKYSDSIMKCFFNALTIILITIISWVFIGDSTPSVKFFIAATIVIISINIYTMNKVIPDSIYYKLKSALGFKQRETVAD
ncbi:UDP N-acetylglucosamine transporter-like nucleotide sugar transporter [Cryptosporidium ryanae]|uniref:UDP N-acetylglucosamine transporter-like nucleotide sugar transporter n=1 Tax=Cryptosporidium ryanae TaxID=515981 RepID=UPI00351A98C2|nr:UDP N-acetylglucosamine transporter-like nucleotide sugar transporter [Cryptosporidium ryanae]